jgi:hypothetical protein
MTPLFQAAPLRRLQTLSLLMFLFTICGCLGRIDDSSDRRAIPIIKALGLQDDMPRILVFGAAWCGPCRKEIDDFNMVHNRFKGKLEVVTLLVEGREKGSQPTKASTRKFISPLGQSPNYRVTPDSEWKLFDSLAPSRGHQLPLVVFVSADGEVSSMFQRSLDLESELLPAVRRFLRGEKFQPPMETPNETGQQSEGGYTVPTPAPTPGSSSSDCIQGCRLPVAAWARQTLPETAANVREAWEKGRDEYFADYKMTYESGMISARAQGALYIPMRGIWTHSTTDTVCTLTIVFNSNGTTSKTTGVCRSL